MTEPNPEDAVVNVDSIDSVENVEDTDEAAARREALLADTPEELAARAPGPVDTGHPVVNGVIASLETLDQVPVDEHVAVFEQAHEELRRTLSGAADTQG
ncbi:MAG: hypothetical protein ACJ72D_02140 [Marmoricola sp.]